MMNLVNASTLKPEVIKGCDIMVVRELIGGIYFGQPRENDGFKAYNTMVYTKPEIVLELVNKHLNLAMKKIKEFVQLIKQMF